MSRKNITFLLLGMVILLAPAAQASFTRYPALGDQANLPTRVESATDKGLIVELIIRCPSGVAVLTYSKAERLYCSPKHACWKRLDAAAAEACGR